MVIQKTVISFAVLWFSAIGASALSITDIGLMVLPDNGKTANTNTCTLSDFNVLAVDLDAKSQVFEDNYMVSYAPLDNGFVRRQLQADTEDAITDPNIMDTTQGHRKLVNCAVVCQGFPCGQCKLVYPSCAPLRALEEEEPMEVSVSLRGSDRELQTSYSAPVAPTVLANGFMSGYSTGLAGATQLCADLKAGLNATVTSVPDRLAMTTSCKTLWSKSFRIGCVYMPAL